MEWLDLIRSQLLDPFRIGLVAALVATASRTAWQMGWAVPLTLGIVFLAVLIPMTTGSESSDKVQAIALGIISNAILLAIMLAIIAVWRGARGKNG